MKKEATIKQIKQRIIDEHRKHRDLDWQEIAARKIYSSFIDEINSLTDEQMKREAEMFAEGQTESVTLTTGIGRRNAIAMGYYWGMAAVKAKLL